MFKLNISKLQKKLQAVSLAFPVAIDATLAELALGGAQIAKAHTKGKLQEATNAQPAGLHQWKIVSNKFYASWYQFGNGPLGGKIYPKTAKALRFTINGETIYRKWVRTSKPHPYMSLAVEWIREHQHQAFARNLMNTL